jgi:hypothetical protein
MGGRPNLQKNYAPVQLIKIYQMRPLLAWTVPFKLHHRCLYKGGGLTNPFTEKGVEGEGRNGLVS